MIVFVLSRFAGVSEDRIRVALDQLQQDLGHGHRALLAVSVAQLVMIAWFLISLGLAQ